MEFFAEVKNKRTDPEQIFDALTIDRLPEYSPSINKVLSLESGVRGEIYSIWGQFTVSRERIRNGVRFALVNCPHAFAWTVCDHEKSQAIVVHCTIDKQYEDEEFIETIENFVVEFANSVMDKF